MLPADPPFVLLDDARPGGGALLFRDPLAIVATRDPAEVRPSLEAVRRHLAAGRHAAGYLAYDAGHALEPGMAPAPVDGWLLWFGIFAAPEPIVPEAFLPDPAGAWAGRPIPAVAFEAYNAAFDRVRELISAGDIYQANLAYRADVAIHGHPLALYARLRRAAQAGWGGVVHDGSRWLLSLSPECFFECDGKRLTARPMKGTAPRGATPAEDAALAHALAADPKERAENLMIVDLIRNDLARVARPGSVAVPALFAVETYPTIQQMVSTVTADLAEGRDAIDALIAAFPCGSITGAPKIRAMEVIAEVEQGPRGLYSGAIGRLGPDGSAAFNVAIRTLVLEEGASHARIGLGSAVVADSTAPGEWAEARAKGAFVTAGRRPFDLIETMRFDPEDGIADLERHLRRLGISAAAFEFRFDRHALRNELHAATFRRTAAARVRALLSPSGATSIETRALPPAPPEPVTVAIVPLPVDPTDFRLRHKSSDRAFYDAARAAAGTFEVIFVRPDGALTEGSFTNLFAPRADGVLVTPPFADGLLPGVLRDRLIQEGRAIEGRLAVRDLADGFFVGNAVRGLISARLT